MIICNVNNGMLLSLLCVLCRHRFTASQELLCHASNVMGQSLLQTAGGKNIVRRNAFASFVNAAKLVHTCCCLAIVENYITSC